MACGLNIQWFKIISELDAELSALSELQSAILSNPDLQEYAEKLAAIKHQCQANRACLDRLTLAQILAKLLPVSARQTINLSLLSLKNNLSLKKELLKPALYESRVRMGMLLRNEKKFDISSEWKSRETWILKVDENNN